MAPCRLETTAGHIYVRGHGPSGRVHRTYPARTLRRWADELCVGNLKSAKVYIYFGTMIKKLRRQKMLRA